MKILIILFLVNLFASNNLLAGFINNGNPTIIWPDIIISRQGDYQNFHDTMIKSREETRQGLMKEFTDALNSVTTQELPAVIALEALLIFDSLYDQHVKIAHQAIGASLATQLKGEIGNLFEAHNIVETDRNFSFGHRGLVENYHSGYEIKAKELIANVSHLMYGYYTVKSKEELFLQIGVENLITGEVRYFQSSGMIQFVARAMAEKLFDFFQREARPSWENPFPNLKWILPQYKMAQTHQFAENYCRRQNGRLPYAQELEIASSGGPYHTGGVDFLTEATIYSVNDKRFDSGPHFLFNFSQMADPRGKVRTSAGMGLVNAEFICVQGEVTADILFVEELFKIYREQKQKNKESVLDALSFLLSEYDSYGNRKHFLHGNLFRDKESALKELYKNKIFILLP